MGAGPPRFAEKADFAMLEADIAALAPPEKDAEAQAAAERADAEGEEEALGVVSSQILTCPGGLALLDAARASIARRKGEAAAIQKVRGAIGAIHEAIQSSK